MTAPLPTLTGKQVVKALEQAGFAVIRVRGSHQFMRHRTDRTRQAVVPVHGKDDLGRGLLRQIINDVGLTVAEFIALL